MTTSLDETQRLPNDKWTRECTVCGNDKNLLDVLSNGVCQDCYNDTLEPPEDAEFLVSSYRKLVILNMQLERRVEALEEDMHLIKHDVQRLERDMKPYLNNYLRGYVWRLFSAHLDRIKRRAYKW